MEKMTHFQIVKDLRIFVSSPEVGEALPWYWRGQGGPRALWETPALAAWWLSASS